MLLAQPLSDPNKLAKEAGASVWWLGQAGFLIAQGGLRIVIDPYLSDSLAQKYRGRTFDHRRLMPPPVAPDELSNVDWLLCTHSHTDHMDPGTIPALLAANPRAQVLAPRAEFSKAIERGVPKARLHLIDAGESLDLGGVIVTATPSAHEELTITPSGHLYLGYVLSGGGLTLWHSGDTVPHAGLSPALQPFEVDLALLPVNGRDIQRASNGVPGNLTLEEAVTLTHDIGAGAMLGHHFGLFDFNTLDPIEGNLQLARLNPAADVHLAQTNVVWDVLPKNWVPRSVLIVCRGNICRSPLAEGILRRTLPGFRVESAAIEDWNVGCPPHQLTQAVAAERGVDLSGIRARQITVEDFTRFDLILCMDRENLRALERMKPVGTAAHIGLLGTFPHGDALREIEDPWGKGRSEFESVHDQIFCACERLGRLLKSSALN